MKKNFTVNISGILFNIDEDAYERLQAYLEQLRSHFRGTAGKDEIISDIESRIAEMMQEKLSTTKNVITIDDISEIVKMMGEPSEFEDEEFAEQKTNEEQKESAHQQYKYKTAKRLYRDSENKVVAGVAGGLGAYFGVDPVWFRLLFIISFFAGGTGIIVYLILWAVIQEAITTAQKLEMRGEPVNIDNIEKSIENELHNIGDKLNEIKDRHFKKKSSEPNIFEKLAHLIVQLFQGLFRFVGIIIGVAFAVTALSLIVAFLVSVFSTNEFFVHELYGVVPFISIPNLLDMIYATESEVNLALTGLLIVVLVPLIGIAYAGIKAIFGIQRRIPSMGLSFFVIWITGIVLVGVASFQTAQQFSTYGETTANYELNNTKSDTLFIEIGTDEVPTDMIFSSNIDIHDALEAKFVFFQDDSSYYNVPAIRYRQSEDEHFHMMIKSTARGKNLSDANEKAENISYKLKFKDSLLTVPAYYSFPQLDCWRNQEAKIYIYVPEGKTVKYLPAESYNDDFTRAVDKHYKYMLRYNYYHPKKIKKEEDEGLEDEEIIIQTKLEEPVIDSFSGPWV